MTITLYIMRRRRIFFQGKGTTFTKNGQNRSKKTRKKAPPLVSPKSETRGAFLCGFYFGLPKAGKGSTLYRLRQKISRSLVSE